jgi:hypothetical protein
MRRFRPRVECLDRKLMLDGELVGAYTGALLGYSYFGSGPTAIPEPLGCPWCAPDAPEDPAPPGATPPLIPAIDVAVLDIAVLVMPAIEAT